MAGGTLAQMVVLTGSKWPLRSLHHLLETHGNLTIVMLLV
jgi:hypothetical protein